MWRPWGRARWRCTNGAYPKSTSRPRRPVGAVSLAADRFFALLETMLPEFLAQLRIRPVGRQGDTVVFALRKSPQAPSRARNPSRVWCGSTKRPGGCRACAAEPIRSQEGAALDGLSVDVTLAAVRFEALDAALLLPVSAAVDASSETSDAHGASFFRLPFCTDATTRTTPSRRRRTPECIQPQPGSATRWKLLGEGAAAVDANNAAGAIAPLREALRPGCYPGRGALSPGACASPRRATRTAPRRRRVWP